MCIAYERKKRNVTPLLPPTVPTLDVTRGVRHAARRDATPRGVSACVTNACDAKRDLSRRSSRGQVVCAICVGIPLASDDHARPHGSSTMLFTRLIKSPTRAATFAESTRNRRGLSTRDFEESRRAATTIRANRRF